MGRALRRPTEMPVRVPISFKEALNRFLDECIKAVPKGRIFDAADHSHLERWASDDRAEAVWRKVQSLAFGPIGSFEPLEGFIAALMRPNARGSTKDRLSQQSS
jgi:hypothetical protein